MKGWDFVSEGYWQVPGRFFDIGPFRTEEAALKYIAGRGVAWLDPCLRYARFDARPVWIAEPGHYWWFRSAIPPQKTRRTT